MRRVFVLLLSIAVLSSAGAGAGERRSDAGISEAEASEDVRAEPEEVKPAQQPAPEVAPVAPVEPEEEGSESSSCACPVCTEDEHWELYSRLCEGEEDSTDGAADIQPVIRPDPDLELTRYDLNRLVAGEPPEHHDLAGLLDTDPGHLSSVKDAVGILPGQIAQMKARQSQLIGQIASPQSLLPPVPNPEILVAELKVPQAPVAPEEPSPPSVKRPSKRARMSRVKREEANEAWAKYDAAMAEYAGAVESYNAEVEVHEEEMAIYEAARKQRDEARVAFEMAAAKREEAISGMIGKLRLEEANLEVRLDISRLRLRYLEALEGLLASMPGPARETLRGLNQPRVALRARADTLGRLTDSLKILEKACSRLHARAAAGSLVGFQAQRDEMVRALESDMADVTRLEAKVTERAGQLRSLAEELEKDGHEARLKVFILANSDERRREFDLAFEDHLRASRTMARHSLSAALSDMEINSLAGKLADSLKKPEAISSVADAENAMLSVRGSLGRADQLLDAIPMSISRHRHAFERELVTVFSPLASEEARTRAYSFSAALLDDLLADLNMLRINLSLWLEERISGFRKIPDQIGTAAGAMRLGRVGAGILLVLVLAALRRKIRKGATRAILKVNNLGFFKRRAGVMVRMMVFLLALLPTALVAGAGYALLALVGFDQPEVRFVEVAFRWIVFYLVGRQVVIGLTMRESMGRPPIFSVSAVTAQLLQRTYGRLGLVLVLAAMADEWSREWLGTGSLTTVVRFTALVWTAGWMLWAMGAWRRVLASSCAARTREGSLPQRLARFGERNMIGALLSPFFFLWLMPLALLSGVRRLAAEGGLLSYLRAKSLRRMSRKSTLMEDGLVSRDLPEAYTQQFPLYPLEGEEGEVLLPRKVQLDAAVEQISRWRRTRQDGSLVITGEKGIGKTTFLALLARELDGVHVDRAYLARRVRSEAGLVKELAAEFGLENIKTIGEIARHLNDGPERVVLLDEAHNVFLRTVDGFDAVDALVRLVDVTSEKTMWVLAFNTYSWRFLRRTNRHVHALRRTLTLPSWSREELQDLIVKRNKRSGLEVKFDEILLDAEASSTGGFELVSSAEGFFRLLWEASSGNPRVATFMWLGALTRLDRTTLQVGLIKEDDAEILGRLDDEMLYALASIVQHENLSFDELRQSLNTTLDEAGHVARFLMEYGFVEQKHNDTRRITLAPRFHQQVLRALSGRNLLMKEDVT